MGMTEKERGNDRCRGSIPVCVRERTGRHRTRKQKLPKEERKKGRVIKMTKKRILVVDDEKDFVKMLQIRLEANGYEVIAAFDGIQGIMVAKREKPDLIILDVMMPAGDGYLVCERLKMSSFTWAIPVIFLSAKSRPEDEVKAYKAGAKYYLTKPYEPEVLLDTVKKALEPSEEFNS